MSEVSVASDRFWREFKSDVAGTLSAEQRGEIERVLGLSCDADSKKLGDLRLSLRWFFVRLVWGSEKRSRERIKQEHKMHPAMARRNVPMLATLFAGYMVFCYAAAVVVSMMLFTYFLN
jgi:hypothetical protein